ncbi:MAG: hypothetical protein R3250_18520, partial [Melioribacteraceae bacterium]|nr:hypothetical protein [Melioribacteraceae bacterium]
EHLHYDLSSSYFESIEKGKNITVFTNESDTICGEFVSCSQYPNVEYYHSYNSIKQKLNTVATLPSLGMKMSCNYDLVFDIGKHKRRRLKGNKSLLFYGFDIGSVVLKDSLSDRIIRVPLKQFENCLVEISGKKNFNMLDSIITDGKVPFRSKIDILVNGNREFIPGEKITKIYIENSKTSQAILWGAFVIVDICLLAGPDLAPAIPIFGNAIMLPIFLLSLL